MDKNIITNNSTLGMNSNKITFTSVSDFREWVKTDWDAHIRSLYCEAVDKMFAHPDLKSYKRYLKAGATIPKNWKKIPKILWNDNEQEEGLTVVENWCGTQYIYNIVLEIPTVRLEIEEGTFEIKAPIPSPLAYSSVAEIYRGEVFAGLEKRDIDGLIYDITIQHHQNKANQIIEQLVNKFVEMDEIKELMNLAFENPIFSYRNVFREKPYSFYNFEETLNKKISEIRDNAKNKCGDDWNKWINTPHALFYGAV